MTTPTPTTTATQSQQQPDAAAGVAALRAQLHRKRRDLRVQRTNRQALVNQGAVPEMTSVKTKQQQRDYLKILRKHGVRPLLQEMNIQDADVEAKANQLLQENTGLESLAVLCNTITGWMADKSKVSDEELLQAREQEQDQTQEQEEHDPVGPTTTTTAPALFQDPLVARATKHAVSSRLPSAYDPQQLAALVRQQTMRADVVTS